MHEDLYDLSSINEAVIISVCFLEDVIISLPVSQGYHPVHRWLEWTKDLIYGIFDEQDNIWWNLESNIFKLKGDIYALYLVKVKKKKSLQVEWLPRQVII